MAAVKEIFEKNVNGPFQGDVSRNSAIFSMFSSAQIKKKGQGKLG